MNKDKPFCSINNMLNIKASEAERFTTDYLYPRYWITWIVFGRFGARRRHSYFGVFKYYDIVIIKFCFTFSMFYLCTCRSARSKLPYTVVHMYRVQDIFSSEWQWIGCILWRRAWSSPTLRFSGRGGDASFPASARSLLQCSGRSRLPDLSDPRRMLQGCLASRTY